MTTFEYSIEEGTKLLYHLSQDKRCASCGTPTTPLWRKGWFDSFLKCHLHLCNACGLKFNKNQFCPKCMYVYNMIEIRNKPLKWVYCSSCGQYAHVDCIQPGTSIGYICDVCKN